MGFVLAKTLDDWKKIRLLVQGEAPGKDEVDESEPFVGKAGWWIRANILANVGIQAGECVFDNTLRCLPPRTKSGEPYPIGLDKVEAEAACRQYDIWNQAPKEVPLMLTGGKALHVSLGLEGISEYHGHITRDKDGRLVGCTFHPSAVMRNPNYLPIVIREFTNLLNAARVPGILARPDVHKGFFRYAAGDLVTDFEWNPATQEMICVGISQDRNCAYSSFHVKEGLELVESHIESGHRIIGHNLLTADLLHLSVEPKSYGPDHVIDTMVVGHLVHTHLAESGLLDLGSLVRFYEPTTDWKHDHSDMLLYNGMDCAYNWRLWKHLERDLTTTDQWHLVEKQQKLAHLTVLMHKRGVHLDAPALKEYAEKRNEDRTAAKATFPFNPNSPPQIVKWCKENGIYVPNAQFDTLLKHQGSNPELDRLIDYRMDSKNITTWFPIEYGFEDKIVGVSEFVYPMFHATGTDVARFSCSDPNFQNLPPALRRFITPRDPELELNAFDGSQIENRTSAWIAGAKSMLDAFASGVDFHTLNAANIQTMLQGHKVTLEEVTRDERQQGKTVTHATNYGETPYSLAGRLFGNVRSESVSKASGLQEAFFRAYPEMRLWHNSLKAQFGTGMVMIRNPFGRVRFVYAATDHEFMKRAAHFLGCSTAAEVVNQRALWVYDELKSEIGDLALPILIVHDELVYEFPKSSSETLRRRVREILDQPIPEMNGTIIPFVPAVGSNYGKYKAGVNEGGLREL